MPRRVLTGRAGRAVAVVAALPAAALALATLSWTGARAVRVVDEAGAPAAGAYVRFHYTVSYINPVHPVTGVARGSAVIRADASGLARVPARLHVRRPFPLSRPPRLVLDHVYVPRLHNAFGPIAEGTTSRPGVFTIDDRRGVVMVFDVSGDPERWDASLRELFECIRETVSGRTAMAAPGRSQTAAYTRELIGHFRTEYAALVERYRAAPRAEPPAPSWASAEERAAWKERVDAHLAREPLWGPYLERMWGSRVAQVDRLEASLGAQE